MKQRFFRIMVIVVVLVGICSPLRAQQKGKEKEEIRPREFIFPKKSEGREEKPPRPRCGPPKPLGRKPPARKPGAPPPVGLGYTIFQKKNDSIVRVDPSRQVFHTGDLIRFLFEPGTDGYLYIIHRENDGEPKLLFPRTELYGGDNSVRAGEPIYIPSEEEPNPDHRWFVITPPKSPGSQATERVTVILSRERLESDAQRLLQSIAALGKFRRKLNVFDDALKDAGTEMTQPEQAAIRGIDLAKAGAPEPSVVVANFGTASLTVARINLLHKTR